MSDEEFANFLFKVNQVSDIIGKLASTDKNLQEIGDIEAKTYLGESRATECTNESNLKVRYNRTLINRKALAQEDNPAVKSQEAFMDEVSRDADQRYKDKLRRKERMETLKKQATLAFRRGEFERALCLYDKAIELIRDSCILYINRALTKIKLKIYDKAIGDCETALRLNENSLRGRLLLAQAYFLMGAERSFEEAIREARGTHPEENASIDEFVEKLVARAN